MEKTSGQSSSPSDTRVTMTAVPFIVHKVVHKIIFTLVTVSLFLEVTIALRPQQQSQSQSFPSPLTPSTQAKARLPAFQVFGPNGQQLHHPILLPMHHPQSQSLVFPLKIPTSGSTTTTVTIGASDRIHPPPLLGSSAFSHLMPLSSMNSRPSLSGSMGQETCCPCSSCCACRVDLGE